MITRLYKYDSTQEANNYRGEDFSKYILSGDTSVDDLTEVLDVVEVTLAGLPFSQEFEPTTKFIYEKWNEIKNSDGTTTLQMWNDWHLCVAEDLVSQPILSDSNYYDHAITFNEASVASQNRIVDNIAVTYKLKDVKIDGKVNINTNELARTLFQGAQPNAGTTFSYTVKEFGTRKELTIGKKYTWQFPDWYDTTSPYYGTKTDWTDFKYYQAITQEQGQRTITLPLPFIEVQDGEKNATTFSKLGYTSVDAVVEQTNLSTGVKTILVNQTMNPCSATEEENTWVQDWASAYFELPNLKGVALNRVILYRSTVYSNSFNKQLAKFDTTPTNRKITFTIIPNCSYSIKVTQHNFVDYDGVTSTVNYDCNRVATYYDNSGSNFVGGMNYYTWENPLFINSDYPTAVLTFKTYLEGEDKKIWLNSAPPENAYNLYQKALLNSQTVQKISGTAITETPQAFYLKEADRQELLNTTIVENFYNQKNWWEMQLEIGKYIHAIPKVRFGSDNRFVTTWKKLGQTQQYDNTATPISIFNSKSVENYISACSSYITNMVQLGGVIDEWVAPKSSSEDYLVYNDVAQIITSKNIIEIVDLQVKCINTNTYGIPLGVVRDLAGLGLAGESENGYVFEENVYELLDVIASSAVNKGLAIYYQLGTNIIKGLDYRLPTINTGSADNDYAIKRILGTVYQTAKSNWTNIKINDFMFHIIYRTKDTVRSDQTRPDLRKYFLGSKYDRVPQHHQFNNQTDTVVDSVKFGNNIYGKLIKTGNTKYTTTEWVPNLSQLKESGQLYNIRDNIYYVAKVKNTYYKDHIISEVEYSKDYNQLSEVIGIPSEPRFYEISEQSLINREVSIDDYIVLGTSIKSQNNPLSFVRNKGWSYVNDLLFGTETQFPKYAITVFKNDIDRKYGTVLGNESFYKDVCHPVSTYSIENTLTMEWDMVDNFSAGDEVSPTTASVKGTVDTAYNTLLPIRYTDVYGRSDLIDFIIMRDFIENEQDLTAKQVFALPNAPVRTRFPVYKVYVGEVDTTTVPSSAELTTYVTQTLGRAPEIGDGVVVQLTTTVDSNPVITYYLYLYVASDDWQGTEIEDKTEYEKSYIGNYADKILFSNETLNTLGDNKHGLGLLKDNREQISVNYNLQLITDSDRFVISSYLWQPNKADLKLALLSEEINKISNDTIPASDIINGKLFDFTTTVDEANGVVTINVGTTLQHVSLSVAGAKAIAIINATEILTDPQVASVYFVCGRNIDPMATTAKDDWYISNYTKDMFPQQ